MRRLVRVSHLTTLLALKYAMLFVLQIALCSSAHNGTMFSSTTHD